MNKQVQLREREKRAYISPNKFWEKFKNASSEEQERIRRNIRNVGHQIPVSHRTVCFGATNRKI